MDLPSFPLVNCFAAAEGLRYLEVSLAYVVTGESEEALHAALSTGLDGVEERSGRGPIVDDVFEKRDGEDDVEALVDRLLDGLDDECVVDLVASGAFLDVEAHVLVRFTTRDEWPVHATGFEDARIRSIPIALESGAHVREVRGFGLFRVE